MKRGEPIEFYAAIAQKRKRIFRERLASRASGFAQALKMFATWPAYAAFEEKDKGSIEVGKLADFTVLLNDIMKIPEPEILKTRYVMTVIGGDILYTRDRERRQQSITMCSSL